MAVNWTGSGRFLLSRHRQRQQTSQTRHRKRLDVDIGDDRVDACLKKNRADHRLPSENASSLSVSIGAQNVLDDAQSNQRPPSLKRNKPSQLGANQSARQPEPFRARFEDRRRWLLTIPNWVAALAEPPAYLQKAKKAKERMSSRSAAQPKHAPMLTNSSHSK